MPDLPSLLTVDEVAARLSLNPETIYRAVRSRKLAHYRFQTSIRIAPEDLAAYLESTRCPALAPPAPNLSYVAASGASSGGTETRADAFQQGRRTQRALDKASRISKPALSVVQQN